MLPITGLVELTTWRTSLKTLASAALLTSEFLEALQCGWADVVFDALGVDGGRRLVDSQREQELIDDFVAPPAARGESLAGGSQSKRFIRLRFHQSFGLQSLDNAVHGDVADRKLPGEVCDPADGLLANRLGDGLDVIFRRFRPVV